MALYGKIRAKLGGKPFCTMVVLAAGSSKRMGRDKLMMEVGGIPVLVRSLQAMQNCAAVDELIVVTRTSRLEEIAALRDRYALTKMTKVVVGGMTRAESSLAGVLAASNRATLIGVHDAARPLVTDVIIILLGGFLLRDVDGIIYGMIVSFLLAIVVDKLMYGINSGKMTLVVTEHGKEICDVIDSCCGRGSTILQGQGGYRCDNKQIVMCVCNNKEMYLLQHAIKEADPASFMIILESNEVHGEGFRTIRIGEGETQAKNSAV